MENKLQELTDKLYEEGLVKGRERADSLVSEAEAKAEKILSDARRQAETMISDARRQTEEMRKNSLSEIALAGRQAVESIRSGISGLVTAGSVGEPVRAAMDKEFVQRLLLAVAGNWHADAADVSLKALLPEDMKSELDERFVGEVHSRLNGGLEIAFSENVKGGFKIGPKDGGYYIGFTDDDFDALLREHLRSKVSEILYGTAGK